MNLVDVVLTATALLAVLGIVLLVLHMSSAWTHMTDAAQRMRYLLLFGLAVSAAATALEEHARGADLAFHHWVNLFLAAALVFVAGYSAWAVRKQ